MSYINDFRNLQKGLFGNSQSYEEIRTYLIQFRGYDYFKKLQKTIFEGNFKFVGLIQ